VAWDVEELDAEGLSWFSGEKRSRRVSPREIFEVPGPVGDAIRGGGYVQVFAEGVGWEVILDEGFGVGRGEDGGVVVWGGEEEWDSEDVVVVAVGTEDEVGLGALGIQG